MSTHLLSSFQLTRVLRQDPVLKTLTLLGTLPNPDQALHETDAAPGTVNALLLIEKTHFAEQTKDNKETSITARIAELISTGNNDIYHWSNAILTSGQPSDPDLKMTIIYPATEAHIQKYSEQERRMVTETPAIYRSHVLPWIEAQPASRLQWVDNILQGLKEQENIKYHDKDPETGFLVIPDSKWDRRTMSSLYLLAISMTGEIRSLRDITAKHLPLLRKMRAKILDLVPTLYPEVERDQVRLYVHYHPSYYHFHVHITHIAVQVPGSTVGQSHLLDTIIDNIENIDADYYSKMTARFALGVEHPVYQLITSATATITTNTAADAPTLPVEPTLPA